MSMFLATGRAINQVCEAGEGPAWKAMCPGYWCHSPGVGGLRGNMVPTGDGLTGQRGGGRQADAGGGTG